ncbi:MAG: isocyanide synthase family protein [Bdellovibrionia bacterium]
MESLDLERLRDSWQTPVVRAKPVAEQILNVFIQYRRMEAFDDSCRSETCAVCSKPHLQKVEAAVLRREPITFVLPAFPGKSPNPAKVLGHLPDMAERQALVFLNGLCQRINRIYEPGAQIIICSDGRVFSDVVGIPDEHVTAYQDALRKMIQELGLAHLSTFNLDDVHENKNFDLLRDALMSSYGQPLEALREKVKRGGHRSQAAEDKEAHRVYCGITRFLFEDSIFPGQTQSRTAIQKSSRARAYEVVRRSNAWSELIEEIFPEAVRLSIHPQTCGGRKLGIQLLGANTWLTPWHGVAVETDLGFTLMKRWEVEKLETKLILDSEGRPSYFQLL